VRNLSAESLVRVLDGGTRFGIAATDGKIDELSKSLRLLADGIDGGTVVVSKVETFESAAVEDFPISGLRLEFVRHKELQPDA
jgi:hypothetical protein